MKTTCSDDDDTLVIRLSDKPIVREVSQDWRTHISFAADDTVVETVILLDPDPPAAPAPALQGKSIKEYAIERLFSAPSNEERALGELKALMEQRMAEIARGEVSDQSLTEIADGAMKAGQTP